MLDRIVEVFCEVDDFCKAFLPQWEAFLIGTGGPAPRGPQPGLSPSEIITLLLVFHLKDPLISNGCICMDETVVLLNNGSFIEQYDRRNETHMPAVQGCQELSRQYSF